MWRSGAGFRSKMHELCWDGGGRKKGREFGLCGTLFVRGSVAGRIGADAGWMQALDGWTDGKAAIPWTARICLRKWLPSNLAKQSGNFVQPAAPHSAADLCAFYGIKKI